MRKGQLLITHAQLPRRCPRGSLLLHIIKFPMCAKRVFYFFISLFYLAFVGLSSAPRGYIARPMFSTSNLNSYSSFGSASSPNLNSRAGDRSPYAARSYVTQSGLLGRSAPLQPFKVPGGIPKNHLHKTWGSVEPAGRDWRGGVRPKGMTAPDDSDWRLRPGYGESPRYLKKINQHIDEQRPQHALNSSYCYRPASPDQSSSVLPPAFRAVSTSCSPGHYHVHTNFVDFGHLPGSSLPTTSFGHPALRFSPSMRSLRSSPSSASQYMR